MAWQSRQDTAGRSPADPLCCPCRNQFHMEYSCCHLHSFPVHLGRFLHQQEIPDISASKYHVTATYLTVVRWSFIIRLMHCIDISFHMVLHPVDSTITRHCCRAISSPPISKRSKRVTSKNPGQTHSLGYQDEVARVPIWAYNGSKEHVANCHVKS